MNGRDENHRFPGVGRRLRELYTVERVFGALIGMASAVTLGVVDGVLLQLAFYKMQAEAWQQSVIYVYLERQQISKIQAVLLAFGAFIVSAVMFAIAASIAAILFAVFIVVAFGLGLYKGWQLGVVKQFAFWNQTLNPFTLVNRLLTSHFNDAVNLFVLELFSSHEDFVINLPDRGLNSEIERGLAYTANLRSTVPNADRQYNERLGFFEPEINSVGTAVDEAWESANFNQEFTQVLQDSLASYTEQRQNDRNKILFEYNTVKSFLNENLRNIYQKLSDRSIEQKKRIEYISTLQLLRQLFNSSENEDILTQATRDYDYFSKHKKIKLQQHIGLLSSKFFAISTSLNAIINKDEVIRNLESLAGLASSLQDDFIKLDAEIRPDPSSIAHGNN